MWIVLAGFLVACSLFAESVSEVIQRSRHLEQIGNPLLARAELAHAANSADSNAEVRLAYAEFLDRHSDPERRTAYERLLESPDSELARDRRLLLLHRLITLSLIENDREA